MESRNSEKEPAKDEEEVIEEQQEKEKETKDGKGKDINEQKEAKGKSESEDEIHAEVYIGGIPTDATEEELKEFCEASGEVVEVRMEREKNLSETKGLCSAFVSFRTMDMASKAISELHHSKFKEKTLWCSMFQSLNRIFIWNIPSKWDASELKKAVMQVGPGIIHVDMLKNTPAGQGLKFGFVEYDNHANADYSLKMMSEPHFKLGTNSPTVRWADPIGHGTTFEVKSVYVKNLPKDVTDEQIKELFERHGDIEKVVLLPPKAGYENICAFVYFREHADAMKAVQSTESYELKDIQPAGASAQNKSNSRGGGRGSGWGRGGSDNNRGGRRGSDNNRGGRRFEWKIKSTVD